MKPTQPDKLGHFGPYGGMFVPETLMEPLNELTRVYKEVRKDPAFKEELQYYLREYVGRPTPLYFAERLTKQLGTARIYLRPMMSPRTAPSSLRRSPQSCMSTEGDRRFCP